MTDTREIPKNLDAENAALGSMALSVEAIEYAATVLKPRDFYDSRNSTLFDAFVSMHEIGIPTDPVTVAEYLQAQDTLTQAGGSEHIMHIMSAVPHAAHIRHYSDTVLDKSRQRQVIKLCKETMQAAYNGDSSDDLISSISSHVEEMISDSGKEIRTVRQVAASMRDRSAEGVIKVPTGFDDLDAVLNGGWAARSLVVIAARPSMGKTSLGVQLAEAAARTSRPALFVSAEMDAEEITSRLPESVLEEIQDMPLLFDDQRHELTEVCNIIRLARRQKRIEMAVVDYLQLIEVPGPGKGYEKLERITRTMKRLAKELRIPIIMLAQLNRKSEDREDSVPQITDIKGGGSPEEDGDVVILLHRPCYYDPKNRPGEGDLMIEKNRHGERKVTVKMGFEESETRFVPYEQRTLQVDEYFRDDHGDKQQQEMVF